MADPIAHNSSVKTEARSSKENWIYGNNNYCNMQYCKTVNVSVETVGYKFFVSFHNLQFN